MLSLRCTLLRYAVLVGMKTKQISKIIFDLLMVSRFLSSLVDEMNNKTIKMYNKTIIGFGYCDMLNYQNLGKSC